MKKVLLVDDEIYSLKGMEVFIPWDKLGLIVCGSTTDSSEAIEIALNEKPDIIVTDINMPCIDGLELINILKDKLPKIQGIVITGYDDFKYAVKAIKLNVIDFILKPLDEEELVLALKKAIKKLSIYNNVVKEDRKLLDIMRGETELSDINHYFKREKISMMFIDLNRRDDLEVKKIIEGTYKILKEKASGKFYVVKPHNYRIVVVKEGSFEEDGDIIKEIIQRRGDISITITEEFNLEEVEVCYKEGKRLAEEIFYKGYGSVIRSRKDNDLIPECEIHKIIEKLYIAFESRRNSLLKNKVEELFDLLVSKRIDRETCISIYLEVLFKLRSNVMEINKEQEEVKLKVNEIGVTLIELKKSILKEIFIYLEIKKEKETTKEDKCISKSIDMINERYMENIKLKDVAKELYLNESYFSRTFKKTNGIGFNEYLTKIRMNKAILFLKEGYKIKEVSKKVGYTDYRSFSLNFKKYTGYSPSEYLKED